MNTHTVSGIGSAFLMLMAGATWAAPEATRQTLPTAKPPAASPSKPMDEAQLDAVSAGQAPAPLAITVQTLTASDSGNSISAANVQTGAVSFAAGALQGFNGIGNFVINTGNNNILQSSLSVTVTPLP